ncbi:MAG: hypothetical protein QXO01_07245 [Nitrososphaerota archaeon]
MGRIVRVKTWDEFKKLAISLRPKSIVYNLHRAPLHKPPICLRFTFGSEQNQYVFLDFAVGGTLRQTKIPVVNPGKGEEYVRDEDIKQFIINELERNDILILCPVWRLEYF